MFWIIFFGIVFCFFTVFCECAFLKKVEKFEGRKPIESLFLGFGISLLMLGILIMGLATKISNKDVPRAIDVARGYAYPKYNVELVDSSGVKTWKVKDTVFLYKEGFNRNNTK